MVMVAWLHIGIILRVYGKEELAQGKGDEMNDFLHLSFHRRERLQLGFVKQAEFGTHGGFGKYSQIT